MSRSLALALVVVASAAHANARLPITNGVYFQPGDPHALFVRTTFGLLISHDDGCTMSWVCEQNLGYGGNYDPKYAVGRDGTIYATTPAAGLRVSRDGGCTFATHPSLPATAWTDALDIAPTGEVWVVTATSGAPNDVFSSRDSGQTFAPRGLRSPTIWWKSVKVAPSSPHRVYVSGYEIASAPRAHLAHRDGDDARWIESPLGGVAYGAVPLLMVSAVDPRAPDVLYVTAVGANPPAGDRLYRSSDAGQTLTQVLATAAPIRDVVVRDASTVLVATQLGGSFRSTNGGMSFEPLAGAPQLACLGERDDGTLIGCAANWQPDHMAVASSSDGGQTWRKVWKFAELYGPVRCAQGTPEHDACGDERWPSLQAQFACTGPACGAQIGHVYGSGSGSDAVRPATKTKTGCCDATGGSAGSLVWVGVVAVAARRARRRPRK